MGRLLTETEPLRLEEALRKERGECGDLERYTAAATYSGDLKSLFVHSCSPHGLLAQVGPTVEGAARVLIHEKELMERNAVVQLHTDALQQLILTAKAGHTPKLSLPTLKTGDRSRSSRKAAKTTKRVPSVARTATKEEKQGTE